MPKHKHLLSAKKHTGKKKQPEVIETANEFLAVGVDFEEAGEKWRAGDAAKSLRFFVRAIDTYDAGLRNFPLSFDLSYNKARLQYEVAQQPRLLEYLPTPLIELLQTTLDSHRRALTIDQDNADLLFNTAQVLTSLAEAISEGKKPTGSRGDALRLFQESLELFQRCLNIQEFKHTQDQKSDAQEAQLPNADSASVDNISSAASNASEEEVWASVEEPVTKDALCDTTIAQLDTLTAVCSLAPSHADLAWVEGNYLTTLKDKVSLYVDGSSRHHEAALAQARFTCALSDAAFRGGRLDLPTYETELNAAFTSLDLDLSNDPPSLCDKADAELAFIASVQAAVQQAQSSELAQISSICWKHITKALDSLTDASKLPDAQNLPRIHIRRGDCELLRMQLGDAPLYYDLAVKSAPTLLKNAEVYFRGAANLGKRDAGNEEEQNEAEVKQSIMAGLAGDTEKISLLVKARRHLVESIVEEMRDDGLLGEKSLQKIGSMFA
ncbi:hypothetical protein HO173_001179 [Letharia columbiana]|uniref:Uncharacterized protein n=1 Tax=Letharia columbiana TaxID=112416 RepID=A0A8H6G4S4_9LECA|nr:uncharacterized protein HO173_001179 [Letharia columbiana]KAF6240511.1 hypothetical protein HO173_001179 [Letharia columbiana]